MFVSVIYTFANSTVNSIFHPNVWDFPAFYLWGKTAVAGYNFYQPENLNVVYNTIVFPFSQSKLEAFVSYIVNVGFLYPPPTIFYFLPFGLLTFKTSLTVWTIFNSIFVLGSIYLIYDLFLKSIKLNGLFLIVILSFILKPALLTIYVSQSNFILLFLLLLVKKYSNNNFSGIFLSIAFFTKPYMIIFVVFFLLRKKWKTILYFVISTLAFSAITLMVFGEKPFLSYLFNNPSLRLPEAVFSEDVNQSLNAVLLRNNIITLKNPLIYLSIVTGIILFTGVYLFLLTRKHHYDYIWSVLLLIGLLIYPGTLNHYGTLLLFIIPQFFNEKSELGLNRYYALPIIIIFYYLSAISVFTAICFLLGLIILKSFISITEKPILPKLIQQKFNF